MTEQRQQPQLMSEHTECDPNCDGTGSDHGPHDCARAGESGQCFAFCEQCV